MLPLKVCIDDFTFEPAYIDLKEVNIPHVKIVAMLSKEIKRRKSTNMDNQGLPHNHIVRTHK